jgi:hypothetical protein
MRGLIGEEEARSHFPSHPSCTDANVMALPLVLGGFIQGRAEDLFHEGRGL